MDTQREKELSEMSLEELWTLFPIILREYSPEYPVWYGEERRRLESLGSAVRRISHIGSTAVPGLLSKPIVDILLETAPGADWGKLSERIRNLGWTLMSDTVRPQRRQSYNKGYTKHGFAARVYHLHVRPAGDWDELYFRDYLVEHPETAQAYASLKQTLKTHFERDRDAYTAAKSEFVKWFSLAARAEYGPRYAPQG